MLLRRCADRRLLPSEPVQFEALCLQCLFTPDVRSSHRCLGATPTTAASSCWPSYLFCFRPDLPPHTYHRPSRPEKTQIVWPLHHFEGGAGPIRFDPSAVGSVLEGARAGNLKGSGCGGLHERKWSGSTRNLRDSPLTHCICSRTHTC